MTPRIGIVAVVVDVTYVCSPAPCWPTISRLQLQGKDRDTRCVYSQSAEVPAAAPPAASSSGAVNARSSSSSSCTSSTAVGSFRWVASASHGRKFTGSAAVVRAVSGAGVSDTKEGVSACPLADQIANSAVRCSAVRCSAARCSARALRRKGRILPVCR